ncbi:MAG: hypothetical protein H0U58_00055 [Chloroflexi bacterium]|nr:hypothetical protein [Chloroflexota bacterium]
MTRPPWEYLFESFNNVNFPDLFNPTWIAAIVLLVVLTILYNLRGRALHRHPAYVDLWEWLWWTGLITFGLIVVEALFVFDFVLVLLTEIVGLATLAWIRFVRFPPLLRMEEHRLARERYYTKQTFSDPETTIRRRGGRRQQRRRRR